MIAGVGTFYILLPICQQRGEKRYLPVPYEFGTRLAGFEARARWQTEERFQPTSKETKDAKQT